MASPQLEKGHTRIANEILNELMKTSLNGTQFRLVMAVWRYTYGFSRKESKYGMSVSYLSNLIDANRTQVDRELKKLIELNIITVVGVDDKGARILSFQKNYKEWGKEDVASSPQKLEVKPKKKKPDTKAKYSEDNSYYKMAMYFFKRVEKVAQEAGLPHLTKKANMQTWADDMRKLVELDGVTKKLAKEVMDWVVTDDFWKTNILSASKLRKQFDQLAIKLNADKKLLQPKPVKDPRDRDIALQQWIADGNDPDEFRYN